MTTAPSVQPGTDRKSLLYVRVSTIHQAEEGASLDAQEKELRALAAAHTPGLPVIVLREEGRSARSGKTRPRYEEAKRLIEDGQVAAVYATKSDRLGRDVTQYLSFLALCHDHGTAVYTKTGEVENTATGKLLSGLLGVVAQFESDLRSERVKEVYEHLRAEGFWPQGKAPWGLTRGPDRILRESPDGHLIRAAFERIDAGAGPMDVTRFLVGAAKQEREVIRLDFVQKLIRNPVYAGYVVADTKSGAPRLIEGRHGPKYGQEPLIPRDLFERVQEKLDARAEQRTRGGSPLSPFGALARCGACGAILRVKRLKEGYAYFECNDVCGGVKGIPTEQLELWVLAYLSAASGWIETALTTGEWRNVLGSQEAGGKIAARVGELERGRETIRTLARTGDLSPEEARADLEATERELRRLRPEGERHTTNEATARADLERLAALLDHGFDGDNIAQLWQRGTTEQRRAALESVLDRIELLPGHIGLTFKSGLRAWADPSRAVDAASEWLPTATRERLRKQAEAVGPVSIPLYVPIDRHRRTAKQTTQYEALGIYSLSFDVAPNRVAAKSGSQSGTTTGTPRQTESDPKSRPPRLERSAGRSPSPPRRPAGARLTVMRRSGHSSSALAIPLLTRSFVELRERGPLRGDPGQGEERIAAQDRPPSTRERRCPTGLHPASVVESAFMAVTPRAPDASTPAAGDPGEGRLTTATAPILTGRERVATLTLGLMVLGFAAYLVFDSRTDAALTALVVLAAILLVIGLIGHRLRSIRYRDAELQLGGLLVDQAVRAQEEGQEERAEALADAASALDPRLEEFVRLRSASEYERAVFDALLGTFHEALVHEQTRLGERTLYRLDFLFEAQGVKVGVEVFSGTTAVSMRRRVHALTNAISETPGCLDALLIVSPDDLRVSTRETMAQTLPRAGVPSRFVTWIPGESPDVLRTAFEELRNEVETLRESPPPS